jgi:hypothetical protein
VSNWLFSAISPLAPTGKTTSVGVPVVVPSVVLLNLITGFPEDLSTEIEVESETPAVELSNCITLVIIAEAPTASAATAFAVRDLISRLEMSTLPNSVYLASSP